jgi:threonine dehydrogenase-like Zn-dependent dehydrogenase
MYEGRTAAEPGITFGHENMGIVEDTGEGVTLLKKGDRVVMPFNVADGRCRNCEEGRTAFCTGVNPGFAGGAYGKKGKLESSYLLSNSSQVTLLWVHTVVARHSIFGFRMRILMR